MENQIFDRRPSRRELLKTLSAAGAGALLAAGGHAAPVNKLTAKGGAIDVHHHHQPPGLALGGRGRGGLGPWSPAQSLEQMDKFGIGVAILSMTQGGDILYDGT